MDAKTNVHELKEQVKKFCEDRDWNQYHKAKDLIYLNKIFSPSTDSKFINSIWRLCTFLNCLNRASTVYTSNIGNLITIWYEQAHTLIKLDWASSKIFQES